MKFIFTVILIIIILIQGTNIIFQGTTISNLIQNVKILKECMDIINESLEGLITINKLQNKSINNLLNRIKTLEEQNVRINFK